MSNGTEQIEARLAAYIDGELSDSERAEIEKYLTANPAHRQMIEELKGQHEMVASLPREKAPAEILDHLQGHLERQSLLENVEDAAGSLRINRWPQFGAIAAMLLLTVGLGALVYSVLPGGALNREQVTIATPDVQGLPAAPSLTDRDKESSIALKDDIEVRRDRVMSSGLPRLVTPGESSGRHATNNGVGGNGVGGGIGGDFVDDISRDVEAKRQDELRVAREKAAGDTRLAGPVGPTSPLALNNGSAIVISTDDPMITQNLLAGYLGQNDFDFHSVRPELARAATSLNELMVLPAEEASKKALAPNAQQAIGSVVSRVNQRENAQPIGEQYMVVRNLSKDQAAKLNGVINSQRGARQQSRFYGNSDLYPEYNQFNRPYNDANAGLQQQAAQQQQLKQEEPQQQRQYPEKAPSPESPNKASDNRAEMAPGVNSSVNANAAGEGAVAGNVPAATQPEADAAVGGVSDVLIVVRSEPPAEPAVGMVAAPPAVDGDAPATAPAASTSADGVIAGGAATQPAPGPELSLPASPVPSTPAPAPAPAPALAPTTPAPATRPAATQPLNP